MGYSKRYSRLMQNLSSKCTKILWFTVSSMNLHEVHSSDAFGKWDENAENRGRRNAYAPLVNAGRSSAKYRNIAKLKY